MDAYFEVPKSDPRHHHIESNVIGEMYEYLIYEKLMKWAGKTSEVSNFVLKGPYITRDTSKKDGFVYDPKYQIYYMSSGETIGEFDAIFSYGNRRCFVEITRSGGNISSLKAGILRKYNLLKLLFPGEEIICWVVTPISKKMSISGVPKLTVLGTPMYKLVPISLKQPKDVISSQLNMERYCTAYDLRYEQFTYFNTLLRLNNQFKKTQPRELKKKANKLLKPYVGLIERIYLGWISSNEFEQFLEFLGHKIHINNQIVRAYLVMRVTMDQLINKEFYFKTENNEYYKLADFQNFQVGKVDKRKRARREIRRLDKKLRQLNEQELRSYWAAL